MKIRNFIGGVMAVCLLGALSSCSPSSVQNNGTPRDPDASITASSTINAFSLHIGDCLIQSQLGDQVTEVPAVPCDQPHDSEVIFIFAVTDTAYSEATINNEAQVQCDQAMVNYVGPNYGSVTPAIDSMWFAPSAQSWPTGDREVDCLVVTTSGNLDLTSSVQGLGLQTSTASPS